MHDDGAVRVCYVPGRESSFVRNRVLVKGMRDAGLIVYDCSYPKRVFYRYFVGLWKFLKFKNRSDIVFVGFFGQLLVPIVKLFTRKKIVFEAFLSAYQTLSFDRKILRPNGLAAGLVRYAEKKSCEMADKVLLDTEQHIDYFLNQYPGLDRARFIRCWLGADDTMALENQAENPGKLGKNDRPFVVHFHGEFQALHGVNYIVEAAALLPEIEFRMIGAGMELKGCKDRAAALGVRNLAFYGMVEFSAIPRLIGEADICLGIFGETEKTRLVIPFKVFESLVMSKPVITADTAAIRELFQHRENIYLCKPADPTSLADAIRTLHQDDSLRRQIAVNGNALFKATCSPARIGQTMHGIFQRELGSGANC